MSDFPYQTPQKHQELIRRVLQQELGRAGESHRSAAVLDDFLAGEPSTVGWVKQLLQSGNPDSDPIAGWEDTRRQQMAGFPGRGWSRQEVDDYRTNKAPAIPDRLLSPGGRMAQQWAANRELIEGYLNARQDALKPKQSGASSLAAGLMADTSWFRGKDPFEDSYHGALNGLANAYQSKYNDEYGQSGWTGFMDNPGEYSVPWGIDNFFDRVYHAIDFGWLNEKSDGNKSGLAKALTSEVPDYLNARHHLGQVDPALPGNPTTRDEKEAAFKGVKGSLLAASPRSPMGESAYDMAYRRENSELPSYFGSTAVEVLKNLVSDPSIVMNAGMAGKGALKIATSPLMKTARGTPVRWYHALHPLGNELGEEAAMQGGMVGPMVAHNEKEMARQPAEYQRPMPTGWKMFSPGNANRTDLPHAQYEKQTEFLDRDVAEQKARESAAEANKKAIQDAPKKSPYGGFRPQNIPFY